MLISGKEAKLAWADGDTVGYVDDGNVWFVDENTPLGVFDSFKEWQIKPRTISINGIEVPAPFEPKEGDVYWVINTNTIKGYTQKSEHIPCLAWRTEDEIKQVVAVVVGVFLNEI